MVLDSQFGGGHRGFDHVDERRRRSTERTRARGAMARGQTDDMGAEVDTGAFSGASWASHAGGERASEAGGREEASPLNEGFNERSERSESQLDSLQELLVSKLESRCGSKGVTRGVTHELRRVLTRFDGDADGLISTDSLVGALRFWLNVRVTVARRRPSLPRTPHSRAVRRFLAPPIVVPSVAPSHPPSSCRRGGSMLRCGSGRAGPGRVARASPMSISRSERPRATGPLS